MTKLAQARQFLEDLQPGLYSRSIEHTLNSGGIVHAEPDCFLLATPEPGDPGTMRILFMCARLDHLRRVLAALPCEHIVWRRDFTNRSTYGERRRKISDFSRHTTFGLNFSTQP